MTSPSNPSDQAFRAPILLRWDRIVSDMDSPDAATSKLVYELLLQVRTIKLILAWVLVIIPIIATIVIIALSVAAKSEVPDYDPYSF